MAAAGLSVAAGAAHCNAYCIPKLKPPAGAAAPKPCGAPNAYVPAGTVRGRCTNLLSN